MKLDHLVNLDDIETELVYSRNGVQAKTNPRDDCTIDDTDELDQLRKVSGALYFYGQILGEIEKALLLQKVDLKTKTGICYQKNHMELQNSKARVTDKMLEHLINTSTEIITIKNLIAELEGSKVKMETIITALRLKDGALNELSRRKSQELRSINKLT
jgi:hypothetical protein